VMALSSAVAGFLDLGDATAGFSHGLADIAVGVGSALLLQRAGVGEDMLDRLRTLTHLLLAAALAATAHVLLMSLIAPASAVGTSYETWAIQWGAVAIAILLKTPLAAAFLARPGRLMAWRPNARLTVPAALALGSTIAAYLGWPNQQDVPLVVALVSVPFLVWIAVGCSTLEVAGVLAAISAVELWLAVNGHGPTADPSWPADLRMLWLQFILLVRGGTVLMLSSAIAERRQAELLVEDQATRLRSMIEAVPDGIVVIDEHGTITFFSAAAERMFGYRASDVVGMNVTILMSPPYSNEHDDYIARYLRTGQKRIIGVGRVVVGRRKDGSTFPIELAVGEGLSHGRHIFTGLIRDVSERQETERRLHELQNDLIHVSRVSAMGELASALAHELNQPLTAVTNYLLAARQLVQRGPEHAVRTSDLVGKAVDQAVRASQVIRQLRGLVQKRDVERARAEIDKLVDEASALAFIGLKEKGVRVSVEREAGLPAVLVDRIQIQQVLINLIRNAVDAMEGRERRELTVGVSSDGAHVKISITDTGAGIAPGMEEKLFQPFFTTKKSGMGVGLSISRTIVEAHGGRLWFEPNPVGGTIFHLVLPLDGAAR
jgi:two-component system sensor kinase FixL